MKFDRIQLKILPAGTLNLSWRDFDRALIFINGQNILDIVKKEEEKRCAGEKDKSSTGAYHPMNPAELYDYLTESEKSKGKEDAAILCCTCDEARCSAIHTKVLKTENSVLWKDVSNEWKNPFKLSFTFELNEYEDFMRQLRDLAEKATVCE